MSVPRRTAVGEQPQYSKLEPLTFQDLCKEILQASPDFRNVQVYGRPGQTQRGIDILAERLSPSGLTVGQCKRFQKFTDTQLRGAVKEFLKYKPYWKRQGVDTFILFISCDTSDVNVQSEFLRQRRRLQKSDIALELWSDSTITKNLRPHSGLVSTYLGGDWATILCGGSVYVPQIEYPHTTNLLFTQLEQMSALHSDAVERAIESAREAWRGGNKKDAFNVVENYRQLHVWPTLQLETRSSLCRLEGQLALDDGQLEQAKTLLAEANSYAPNRALRLEALILRAERRTPEARELLEDSSDPDSVTMYAALSLELGEIETALKRLDTVNNLPDGHRLRAVAYLMSGDPDKASDEIAKATLLAPGWTINRFTAAVIDYYACLSPARRLQQVPPWPEPPHWTFVRTDDEARTRLSRAAAMFRVLQTEPNSHFQLVRALKTWELACVANDPTRGSDADALCRKLLQDDPANEYCLVWAVARRFDVDTAQPRALLEQKARTPEGAYESVISLLICYLEDQDIEAASQLIEASREDFARINQLRVWQFWHDQIAAIQGGESEDVHDSSISEPHFLALSLRSKARIDGDRLPLTQFLEKREAEGSVEARLELCELYIASKRWSDAVPLADKLLETMRTTEALRLACTIFLHAGLYSKCADSIEEHRTWFPLSQLPVALIQMKASAEQRSGQIRSAVRSAEDALSLEPNRINLRNLAELYLESGDFTALAQLASRHERYPDLTTDDLLILAARLSGVNQPVGVSLWKRAVDIGVLNQQVAGAISIGYSLSMDSEIGPLMERLSALPREEGIQRLDVVQMQTILLSRHQAATETFERYRAGETPLQVALAMFGSQLSYWFGRRLEDNESNQKIQHPTYARHGWRSRNEPFELVHRRVCVDLTSLLLARRLGVLSHVVQAYRPLHIPHRTPLALAAMREATFYNQPTRKVSLFAVQSAISNKLITILPADDVSPLASLESNRLGEAVNTVVVNFDSPEDASVDDCDDRPSPRTYSPHSVIRRVNESGRLSSDRSTEALIGLGIERESLVREIVGASPRLLISVGVMEAFARVGVLQDICDTCDVYIRDSEARALSAEIKNIEKAEDDSACLTSMIEEIRVGLESGDYKLLPMFDNQQSESQDGEEPLALQCTADLLRYQNLSTDLIWIDDRMINAFIHRDGSKIVDSVDMLSHLRNAGKLSDADFFRYLNRYRASGLRFLALRKDEILYWLNAAIGSNGEFKESYELFVIRLSHARALGDSNALRTAPVIEGQTLEWPFLLDSSAAVLDAMQAVWYQQGQDKDCAKKAKWILDHLYTPDRGRSSALGNVSPESDMMMEAVALGGLIASTCAGFALDEHGQSRRRAYLNWLYHRLILPRFETDAELREVTLSQVTQLLYVLHPQKRQTRRETGAIAQLFKLWLGSLPEQISDRVAADNGLMNTLGVKITRSVVIGDMHFGTAKFWSAARELLRTGTPVSLGQGRLISYPQNGLTFLITENVQTGEKSLLEDFPLELLASTTSQREKAIIHAIQSFDLPQRDADNLRQVLRDEDSPAKVMERLVLLRAQSAQHFYRALEEKLCKNLPVALSDLIPSDMLLFLRHLRLEIERSEIERNEGTQDVLETLSTSLSVEDALDRLAQLPRALPNGLLDRISVLSISERRKIFKRFTKRAAWNIVPLAHVCNLYYTFESDNRAYSRFADRLLKTIRSAEGAHPIDALLRILENVESELRLNRDFTRLPVAHRLLSLWSHASNLLLTMAHLGVDLKWIGDNFGNGWNRLPTELFNEESEYWRDVAHPSRLSSSRLVLSLAWFASRNGVHLAEPIRQEISNVWKADGSRVIELLFDASREPDSISSFFAESTGWPGVFVGEASAYYSSSRSPAGAKEAATLLLQGGDPIHWAHLHAVLRNGIIPEEAHDSFRTLFLEADFEKLRVDRPELTSLALTFASMHAHTLGAQVVDKVRSDILKMVRTEPPAQTSRGERHSEDIVLSAAFYLYRRSTPQERQYEQTSALWKEMVEVRQAIAGSCQLFVDRLVEALPNHHSRYLWKLQVFLRSCNVALERE